MSLSKETMRYVDKGERAIAEILQRMNARESWRSFEGFIKYASYKPSPKQQLLLTDKYKNVCLKYALNFTQGVDDNETKRNEFRYGRVAFFSLIFQGGRDFSENFTIDTLLNTYCEKVIAILGNKGRDSAITNNILIIAFLFHHAMCMERLSLEKGIEKNNTILVSKNLADLQLWAYSSYMELLTHFTAIKRIEMEWKHLPNAASMKEDIISEHAKKAVSKRWSARNQKASEWKPHIDEWVNQGVKHHKMADELMKMAKRNPSLCSYSVNGGAVQEMKITEVKNKVKEYLLAIGRDDLIHGMQQARR